MTDKKDEINTIESSPSIAINGQYIKELHVDNVNSPASFAPSDKQPKIDISINFNNRNVDNGVYEVTLILKANAKSQDENNLQLFDVKLAYAALVTLNNVSDEAQKEAILMVHIPTLVFPYARHLLSNVTRDAGFQPLVLEPLDFAKLHAQRKEREVQ